MEDTDAKSRVCVMFVGLGFIMVNGFGMGVHVDMKGAVMMVFVSVHF